MNDFGEDYPYPHCYFHPREVIVGVCAPCLKEKLLVLASKQGHFSMHKETHLRSFTRVPSKKPSINIPKVFALGSSFLHRLEFGHHRKPGDDSDEDSIMSQETLDDSFISIKFEDNGRATWDKKTVNPNPTLKYHSDASCDESLPRASNGARSVVELTKPRGTLRWRKRIGHLFQLVRWKRSTKANACHVGLAGKVEAAKGRKGWMRSLTRRRTTE